MQDVQHRFNLPVENYVELSMDEADGWVCRVDGSELRIAGKTLVKNEMRTIDVKHRLGERPTSDSIVVYPLHLRNALPDGSSSCGARARSLLKRNR